MVVAASFGAAAAGAFFAFFDAGDGAAFFELGAMREKEKEKKKRKRTTGTSVQSCLRGGGPVSLNDDRAQNSEQIATRKQQRKDPKHTKRHKITHEHLTSHSIAQNNRNNCRARSAQATPRENKHVAGSGKSMPRAKRAGPCTGDELGGSSILRQNEVRERHRLEVVLVSNARSHHDPAVLRRSDLVATDGHDEAMRQATQRTFAARDEQELLAQVDRGGAAATTQPCGPRDLEAVLVAVDPMREAELVEGRALLQRPRDGRMRGALGQALVAAALGLLERVGAASAALDEALLSGDVSDNGVGDLPLDFAHSSVDGRRHLPFDVVALAAHDVFGLVFNVNSAPLLGARRRWGWGCGKKTKFSLGRRAVTLSQKISGAARAEFEDQL
jgi:hypothetical protein